MTFTLIKISIGAVFAAGLLLGLAVSPWWLLLMPVAVAAWRIVVGPI